MEHTFPKFVEESEILSLCLGHAQQGGWAPFSFYAVSCASGIPLSRIHLFFQHKTDVLKAHFQAVDQKMLQMCAQDSELALKDGLFEVIMCRFEILEPYKMLLRDLQRNSLKDPALAFLLLTCQKKSAFWMLESMGRLATQGFSYTFSHRIFWGMYSFVFQHWLAEDSLELNHTMVILDQTLDKIIPVFQALQKKT